VKALLERPIVVAPAPWPAWASENGHNHRPRSVGKKDDFSDPAPLATNAPTSTHVPVLVVDDEHDIRDSLRGFLEDEGYIVAEAADGLVALDYLRASGEPHVVLLDYKMPRMNGAELLEAIISDARLSARDAFVLVTANLMAFPPELNALLAQLGIPILAKPFNLAQLLRTVETAERRIRSAL
jgi:two-component system chemotaxis response regulator CheY